MPSRRRHTHTPFKFKSCKASKRPLTQGEGSAGAASRGYSRQQPKQTLVTEEGKLWVWEAAETPETPGRGRSVRLSQRRKMGAHPAPLSCEEAGVPGNKGAAAAILGCEATHLAEASGCLSAALSPHPLPCPCRNGPHRLTRARVRDLPGAASRLAAATLGTGRRTVAMVAVVAPGAPGGLRGPGPGPRLRRRRSAKSSE